MSNTKAQQPSADAGPSQVPALLDHLVWLAGDLDTACAEFEAASGVTPVYGGAHPSGTHNALVSLGERVYLEIAAPVAGAQAGHPWVDAARRRPEPHLYSYCMRSSYPLEKLAEKTRGAGMSALGPFQGSRVTPEGAALKWQLFIPIVPDAGNAVPFLIDWQDTPHPAATTASETTLTRFDAHHPEPESIRDAMALLAPGVSLNRGQDRSKLVAELNTPRGSLILET
ncbi:MAG: VOC family protein [Pseudomonadota bacterium]